MRGLPRRAGSGPQPDHHSVRDDPLGTGGVHGTSSRQKRCRGRVLAPGSAQRREGAAIGRGVLPGARLHGATAHFNIWVQPALGGSGTAAGAALLARCEADYARLRLQFGGLDLAVTPVNVILADLGGLGAYHLGGAGADLYCGLRSQAPAHAASFAFASQLAELFQSAQQAGWTCERSAGESLSRALAASLYPGRLRRFATAHQWLDSARPDFVNVSAPSDTNPVATGCGVLFLNYLRHQLGYNWRQIVAAGGDTLARTYALLTGEQHDPFPAFA